MYLAFHRRVVTFDNRGTSTRLGNVPKLLKRQKYGIIDAKQAGNQNSQVKAVLGFVLHCKTGSYNSKLSIVSILTTISKAEIVETMKRGEMDDLLQQCTTNIESAGCQQPVNTHLRDQLIKAMSQKQMSRWYNTT